MVTKDLGGYFYSLQQIETQCESTEHTTQVSLIDAHMSTNDSECGHEVGLRKVCRQESTNKISNLKKPAVSEFLKINWNIKYF